MWFFQIVSYFLNKKNCFLTRAFQLNDLLKEEKEEKRKKEKKIVKETRSMFLDIVEKKNT